MLVHEKKEKKERDQLFLWLIFHSRYFFQLSPIRKYDLFLYVETISSCVYTRIRKHASDISIANRYIRSFVQLNKQFTWHDYINPQTNSTRLLRSNMHSNVNVYTIRSCKYISSLNSKNNPIRMIPIFHDGIQTERDYRTIKKVVPRSRRKNDTVCPPAFHDIT